MIVMHQRGPTAGCAPVQSGSLLFRCIYVYLYCKSRYSINDDDHIQCPDLLQCSCFILWEIHMKCGGGYMESSKSYWLIVHLYVLDFNGVVVVRNYLKRTGREEWARQVFP